ncbi:MAG: aminopeptidase [bacterium]|uniref:M18 family aminopeptidase n=2 Tax=Bacteria candidate phyla TaxID=1783234 RepID=A0A124G023_UNCT6|nr:MAG: M18 family aminopeptidase [candidate division TA06 bacterium 32_111]KUK86152.1 MAG: M18 family aminopeptidase [candidate division TA06 bacterium 34_109]MDI6700048.1 aminopeptidase [bacterium]HCP17104.1 aminopeptidase [candidate division WOR-3 bacterium]
MKNEILYLRKNGWEKYDSKGINEIFDYGKDYIEFLKNSKTERLTLQYLKKLAEKKGYSEDGKEKFYLINKGKNIAFVNLGNVSPLKGIKLIGSHSDAPRIDIKQNPLYEKEGIAHFKTHYYGGIKKYHYLARPLSLYGVVIRKDGKRIDISVGDKEGDPVFTINDLLPHLSKTQYERNLKEAFEGEKLNIIVGSIPLKREKENPVKKMILKILNEKYGIVEEDFISSELEIVPQGSVFEVGFDRSFVGGYGHDDRICSFTSTTALFNAKNRYTVCSVLFDKEEVGSTGATGARSLFLEDLVIEILKRKEIKPTYENIREVLKNSDFISADVSAGIDPDFQEVHEKQNGAKIGYGVVITKFTGSGGKSGANDANAEYLFKIKEIFNKNDVTWQTAELGKVDAGGGGTIAGFLAFYNANVIDCGPALLGMHSPFELVSKVDLFETFKAYRSFYESKE